MPAITTDPDVALAMWLQLHDSAFPSGRMVHSQGLEQWLADRPDVGAPEVGAVVLAYLADGYAPLDGTLTAAAWRAAAHLPRLCELDDLAGTYKLFDNARTASESAGTQLAAAARRAGLAERCPYLTAVTDGATAGHGAVVDGALQAQLGVPQRLAVLGSMRSMLASMLSAAVRMGRLGALQAQRFQTAAAPRLVELARAACDRDIDDVYSVAPALEIGGMRHETRTTRLFTT